MEQRTRLHLIEAIGEARAAFLAALRAGDAVSASMVYAERARLMAPSAEVIAGRTAIAAYWGAGLEAGVTDVDLETLELNRRDSVAYEIGRYAVRAALLEGGTVIDRGKYASVHERQPDGSWLKAVEVFNPDAPPERTR